LFGCVRAKEVWREFGLLRKIEHALIAGRSGSIILEHILRFSNKKIQKLDHVILHGIIEVGGWYIWWKKVKGESVSPPKNSAFAVKALTANFMAAKTKSAEKEIKWFKPLRSSLKLNIDASYHNDVSGSAGMVLQNDKGEVFGGGGRCFVP
jgi:hypothetical protein